MKKSIVTSLMLSALFAFSAVAQAGVIYSDTFSSETAGLNLAPNNWKIGNSGTVDTISKVNGYTITCEYANCIDLDGTTNASGLLTLNLSPSLMLTAGVTYTAYLDIGGNQRLDQTDNVTVDFGGVSKTFSITENAAITTYSISFTPTVNEAATLTILDNSTDDVGAILDSVSIVPEPGTCALVGLGLLGLFAAMSRRQQNKRW